MRTFHEYLHENKENYWDENGESFKTLVLELNK